MGYEHLDLAEAFVQIDWQQFIHKLQFSTADDLPESIWDDYYRSEAETGVLCVVSLQEPAFLS